MALMKEFGKYDVIQELGRGAFGVVYLAKDKTLDRKVAIKVLHPALLVDPEFVERFKHEARVAAKLDHPNIVPVYDFGQHEGRFFLAMAFMPGGSLSARIKEAGPVTAEQAIKISKEIGAGLAYAHERTIIHRDLKPSNILFDEKGIARVSDMGFAKVMHGGTTASLTASGQLVGTPSYMAPEVWKGKPATPASDVYSLACISMELFTGTPFFDGDSTPEIMLKHFQPREIPECVPADIKPVLQKALAEKAEDRFADIPTYLNQLEHQGNSPQTFSEPKAKHEPAPHHRDKTKSKPAKPKLIWALIGTLVALMIAFIILGSLLLKNKEKPKTTQKTPTINNVVEVTNTPSAQPSPTPTPVEEEAHEVSLEIEEPTHTATPEPSPTSEPTPGNTPKPTLAVGSTMIREKDGMTMVYVPAGEFLMGSPTRTETTGAYWIDQTEVTVSMYKQCAEDGVCDLSGVNQEYSIKAIWYYDNEKYINYPAVGVTWDESNNYCQWAGGRLPTEAEWEKAGRGPNGNIYPWGNTFSSVHTTSGDTIGRLYEPKRYSGNKSFYGAFDMVGNAMEWVANSSSINNNKYLIKGAELSNGISYDRSENAANFDGYLYQNLCTHWWSPSTQEHGNSCYGRQIILDSVLSGSTEKQAAYRSPIRGFRCAYDVDAD